MENQNIQKYSDTEGAFYPEVKPEIKSLDALYTELGELEALEIEVVGKKVKKQAEIDALRTLGVKTKAELDAELLSVNNEELSA